jgi:hypothetical protein
MGEVSEKPVVAEGILTDHRHIRDVAKVIESTGDLSVLLKRLAEFRAVLEQHFVVEEAQDGFYETLRITAPRHIGKIDKMKREHGVFLADLDRVLERVKVCLAAKGEILREAQALTRRLWDHETREDSLLLDSIYTDLGQGDG